MQMRLNCGSIITEYTGILIPNLFDRFEKLWQVNQRRNGLNKHLFVKSLVVKIVHENPFNKIKHLLDDRNKCNFVYHKTAWSTSIGWKILLFINIWHAKVFVFLECSCHMHLFKSPIHLRIVGDILWQRAKSNKWSGNLSLSRVVFVQ